MGYEAPLEFSVEGEGLWAGCHRPQLIDLSSLFQSVLRLDHEQLAAGGGSAASAWRQVMPTGYTFVRALGPHTAHIHDANALVVKDFVLKVIPPRSEGGLSWITDRMERSRAHRAHLWSHRLRALGLETPRPLGYVERTKRPNRHFSFVATEYEHAPTLVELRETKLPNLHSTSAAIQQKRALIDRVAGVLRTMHRHGLFHADLHAGNVLVSEGGVLLIDLESMRRVAPSRHRMRMKNLVRLNRDFLDTKLVSRTDRMRFLRSYLRHEADKAQRCRDLWAEVLKATELKLLERGEAFQ